MSVPVLPRWLLALAALALAGCEPAAYVARAACGQLRVLNQRRPIADLLREPSLPPEKRAQLELVLAAREHAIRHVGLRRTRSYTYYYEAGPRPIAYNLEAAPRDALRSLLFCFPVVGCLPYKGYFDRQRAEARAAELEAAGYDVLVRPVPAYSTLGWFADPVFSGMLERDAASLVSTVIHEMTHTTVFARGQVAWNEGLATFVGNTAGRDLLCQRFGSDSAACAEAGSLIADEQRFAELLGELTRELRALYGSPLSRGEKLARRQAVFAAAQARFRRLWPQARRWGKFGSQPLDNAVVMSYAVYHSGTALQRRLYEALGRDLGRLMLLAREAAASSDPEEYERTWLQARASMHAGTRAEAHAGTPRAPDLQPAANPVGHRLP